MGERTRTDLADLERGAAPVRGRLERAGTGIAPRSAIQVVVSLPLIGPPCAAANPIFRRSVNAMPDCRTSWAASRMASRAHHRGGSALFPR